MTGKVYGRLTVVQRAENTQPGFSKNGRHRKHGDACWTCLCECGVKVVVKGYNLRSGGSNSCGCLKHSRLIESNTRHGMAGTPEYVAYLNARKRCRIDRFRSFDEFYAALGTRPHSSFSVDRIDNHGNYEVGNVRWTDRSTQMLNSRKRNRISNLPTGVIRNKRTYTAVTKYRGLTYRSEGLATAKDAAQAYNEMLASLHGEMAHENKVGSTSGDNK